MTLQGWMADSLLDRQIPWWSRYLAAGVVTLASILVVALLWRHLGAIPDPGLILLFTVATATYLAGGMAGMLSAAIVLFCSFVLFSHPLYPFRYSDMDWRQMMVIVVACPVIALMVGSLKEQVDQLKVVTREAEALRGQIRQLEMFKDAQFLCEQRFRLMTECLPDYAVFGLDANGAVRDWNAGAERLFGYAEHEIAGQSFTRFFTHEDLVGRHPERLLEQARFSGHAAEEGWRLHKGGGRMRVRTILLSIRNAQGTPAGCLMVMRDLTPVSDVFESAGKS